MNLIITNTQVDEKLVTDMIYQLVKDGTPVYLAIQTVMKKKVDSFDTFYTSANVADIKYCIKRSTINDTVKSELIRNHDKHTILHELDWLRYHLYRAGFKIEYKSDKKCFLHFVYIPKIRIN